VTMQIDGENAARGGVHADMPTGDMYAAGAPGLQEMPAGGMTYRSNDSQPMQGVAQNEMPAGRMNDNETPLPDTTSDNAMPRGDMNAPYTGGALVTGEMPSGAMTAETTATSNPVLREMPAAASVAAGAGLSLAGRWQLNVQLDSSSGG